MPPVVIEEWAAPEPEPAPSTDAPHADEEGAPADPAEASRRDRGSRRAGATAIDHLPPVRGDEGHPATPEEPATTPGSPSRRLPPATRAVRQATGPGTTTAGNDTAGNEAAGNDAAPGGATAIDFGAPDGEQDEDLTQPIPVQHPPQEQHPH